MNKKHKKNRKNWKLYLILGSFSLKLFSFFIKKIKFKDNFKKFKKEEKREITEFENGKESFDTYINDSKNIFIKYFIPHHSNNHKPKILHTSSLVGIAVVLLLIKISLTGYLFFLYPRGAEMSASIVDRVLQLTNKDREANNDLPLTLNPILTNSALDKANDMLEKNYFAHYSPDGKRPWDFINRNNYRYIFVGENLAMNFTTADSVHKALMASPTHKKNILNDRYTEIGLAMVNGMIDGKNTNILVELFATRNKIETAIAKNAEQTPVVAEVPSTNVEKVNVLGQENDQSVAAPSIPIAKEISANTKIGEPMQEVEQLSSLENNVSQKELPELIPEMNRKLALEPDIASSLEVLNSAHQIKSVPNIEDQGIIFSSKVARVANIVFLVMLAIMILSLFINIIVRIEIQHRPVIIQTLMLIIFIVGLLSIHFHYLENGLVNILLL